MKRELDPIRYDTPEKKAAEVSRRQKIGKASTLHFSQQAPEDQANQIARLQNLTPEVREARIVNIGLALAGRLKPKESVLQQSTTWVRLRGLFARGASVPEVVGITGLTTSQAKNALYRDRPAWQRIYRPKNAKLEKERKRAAQLRRYKKDKAPEDIEKMNRFAKLLWEEGLIDIDISSWKKLRSIYKQADRQLPEDSADKVRLEIFLRARRAFLRKKPDLLIKYKQLGDSIDPQWFSQNLLEEERFIVKALSPDREVVVNPQSSDCVHRWVVGQPQGGKADGKCMHCGEHKAFSEAVVEHGPSRFNGIGSTVDFYPRVLRATKVS